MTRTVIAGNWKMNMDPRETREFFSRFSPELAPGVEVLLFPSALSLTAARAARPSAFPVALGVQNIHWESKGAFTGEISARMAGAAGASHALIGHSERRHVFGETDEEASRKIQAAMVGGLIPVLCVGETLDERRAGQVDEVILRQLDAALDTIASHPDMDVLLAYEPVWAIGTGETATPEDATAAHGTLRGRLVEALGTTRGSSIPLLYGGSVKPDNAAELLGAPNIDGVLVGGASLDPESFSRIVAAGGMIH